MAQLSQADRAWTRNREVGFIFQSFNLIGGLTVYENVELPLTYRGMKRAERRERVTEALEKVEMAHRAKHLPSQLSGGQQQRVAVARAVAGQPSILLADEPTGNLDSKNGEAVMGLLQALHDEGSTVCMVTHDPRYAEHARGCTTSLLDERQAAFAARRSQKSSKRPLRMQQRRAMMALAPATVQRMPARLSRAPICLHPASTTPDETHRPLARNCG